MNRTTRNGGGSVTVNTDPLAKLRTELQAAASKRVHVGVLGGKDARQDMPGQYTPGNAEIGAIHEFGITGGVSPLKVPGQSKQPAGKKGAHVNIPERSWLRMPVITKLPEAINAQSRAKWRDSILRDGVSATLKRLGILAEAVIQDAFATGGFGTWAKLSKVTIRRKKSAAILIASAQLRQSVTSRVVG